jgi:2-oxoisovalerate dehydrogenase E2 component (dihydrolipoyl transacylase)
VGIHVIKVPDIGEGIAEVELVEWHVQPGDAITEDQALADVMTDKANVEIPTPVAGKVIALGGKPGDTLAVGSELIRLEVDGTGNVASDAAAPARAPSAAEAKQAVANRPDAPDDAASVRQNAETSSDARAGEASKNAKGASAQSPAMGHAPSNARAKPHIPASAVSGKGKRDADTVPVREPDASLADANNSSSAGAAAGATPQSASREAAAQVLAAPAVRQRAARLGIDLGAVRGSGPDGRVTHDDLDAHLAGRGGAGGGPFAARPAAAATTSGAGTASVSPSSVEAPSAQRRERNDEETVQVIGLRRKIAQKMQEAKRRIPHFTYVEEVDVTELEAVRAALNDRWAAARGKLTVLPFLMRAIVRALPDFPQINARYDDDAGTVTRYGAVHLGIATQTGSGLVVPVVRHVEVRDLWSCAAEVARLADAARSGKASRDELTGSTLTITSLGPLGGIVTTPVINHPEVAIVGVNRIVERPVIRMGAVVPRLIMNLSSSFDHRVVDGMDGARFVQALRGYLETPTTLFID